MNVYKYIILAVFIAMYSCGGTGNGDHPASNDGGTSPGAGAGAGSGGGGTVVTSGSLGFTSAVPQVIGIQGSGQPETSQITFTVRDSNGDPLSGMTVDFVMSGPNGGEFITPSQAVTTASGRASTTLNSGTVSGPVSISASVVIGTSTITSSPAAISIGGGVPSATHFNLAASKLNLQGLLYSGIPSQITAYIGDRFGNYNVLEGTSVSFYTEAGAIDTSNILDDTGLTTVVIRTQSPMPANVNIAPWETININNLNATYGTAFPSDGSGPHMRDGWVTVLATVQGEEAFNDANANGVYDAGEVFEDLGEPFYDKNDDGCRNDGAQMVCYNPVTKITTTLASTDPFEEFIDANGDGLYDAPNGVWDGPNCPGAGCRTSKTIWDDITMQFTGNATTCAIAPPTSGIAVADGGSTSIQFMVSDFNLNMPIQGTQISVKHTGGGKLFGATSYTIPDGVSSGPYQIAVTVADDDFGDTDAPEFFSLEFEVTSTEVVTCVTQVATGTVD